MSRYLLSCGCDPVAGQSCRVCDGTDLRAAQRAERLAQDTDRWLDAYRAAHGHDYAIGGLPGCPTCRPAQQRGVAA